MPKVVSVDEPVGEPEGDMVRVVVLLAFDIIFEGEVTSHVCPAGSNEGVKAGHLPVGTEGGDELFAIGHLNGLIDLGEL